QGHLEGEVLINGEEIKDVPLKELSSKINILFQEPDKQIFMPVVEEEIAFGLENHCLPREEMRRRIDYYLELLGIESLRKSKTNTLSFGQKKLVSFASILTLSPQIYLLDEFTAGIEGKIVNIFSKICETLKKEGKTLILIDHNPVILDFADKTIDLDTL
ncbi:MAG: ABC transporter ATP-binding protein, partial [Candidatus Cloacimonas sp.]|nr:energy-coupling factor ABC transporter ATP-binding protein [Candidatus Cloacimonadota bacterium]